MGTDTFNADTNELDFDLESAQDEVSEELFGSAPEGEETTAGKDSAEAAKKEVPEKEVPEAAEGAKGKPEAEAATAPPADSATPPSDETSDDSSSAPGTWRKEAKAEWDKLPATVREEILKREADMFRGIEGYRADAALGNTVKQIVQPHLAFFQRTGENPLQLLNNLTQAHIHLSSAPPAQRRELFLQVAKSYGVDLLSEPAYVDPAVASLQTELHTVKSQLQSRMQMEADAERSKLKSQLDAFIADPKNEHVNDVLEDMAKLLQGGVASSLEDAYQKACRLSPAVQAKELARQREVEAQKAKESAAEKAAAARQAASANVRTKSKPASAATPVGTMDDTLHETLAGIKARS